MKSKYSYTSRNLKGNNIYQLKYQTIYYDWITKNAYIISDYNALYFQTWRIRLPFCLIVMGLIILFTQNYQTAVLAGIGIYVVSSVLFRILFFKKLPVNGAFKKPESKGLFRDLAIKFTKNNLIIIAMIFGSMGLSLLINQLIRGISGPKVILIYVIVVVSLLATLGLVYSIYLKDKENL